MGDTHRRMRRRTSGHVARAVNAGALSHDARDQRRRAHDGAA